jgi:hypothetical protein
MPLHRGCRECTVRIAATAIAEVNDLVGIARAQARMLAVILFVAVRSVTCRGSSSSSSSSSSNVVVASDSVDYDADFAVVTSAFEGWRRRLLAASFSRCSRQVQLLVLCISL